MSLLSTLIGHTHTIQSVAWSPLLFGHKIVSSSNDLTIKIWNTLSHEYECLGTLNVDT